MSAARRASTRRRGAMLVIVSVMGAATAVFGGSSEAQVGEVSGDAYGHYTSVSLFGGPAGQNGPDPIVTLKPAGTDGTITAHAPTGVAKYGPATIFGGQWPLDVEVAPSSGPLDVSIKGSPGPGGSVTATSKIGLYPTPIAVTCSGAQPGSLGCKSVGGFGPVVPNQGDSLEATCTANEQGVTGATKIVNGMLATSTDESGEPKDTEPIPENPPPNYTKTGQITNVHDNWKIVYNEQIIDPDGAITVNAIHMSLLGPIAIGEQILGHVRCSMHGLSSSPTTAVAATAKKSFTSSTPAEGAAPAEAAPATEAETKDDTVLILLAAGILVVGVGGSVLFARRRQVPKVDALPE